MSKTLITHLGPLKLGPLAVVGALDCSLVSVVLNPALRVDGICDLKLRKKSQNFSVFRFQYAEDLMSNVHFGSHTFSHMLVYHTSRCTRLYEPKCDMRFCFLQLVQVESNSCLSNHRDRLAIAFVVHPVSAKPLWTGQGPYLANLYTPTSLPY